MLTIQDEQNLPHSFFDISQREKLKQFPVLGGTVGRIASHVFTAVMYSLERPKPLN